MVGSRFERVHEYFVRTKDYLYGVTLLIIECMIDCPIPKNGSNLGYWFIDYKLKFNYKNLEGIFTLLPLYFF